MRGERCDGLANSGVKLDRSVTRIKSISRVYEPSSEPLHISARLLFLLSTRSVQFSI